MASIEYEALQCIKFYELNKFVHHLGRPWRTALAPWCNRNEWDLMAEGGSEYYALAFAAPRLQLLLGAPPPPAAILRLASGDVFAAAAAWALLWHSLTQPSFSVITSEWPRPWMHNAPRGSPPPSHTLKTPRTHQKPTDSLTFRSAASQKYAIELSEWVIPTPAAR